MKGGPTPHQVCVLRDVFVATRHGGWYRAESSGERVTLASLFRHGVLARRAWRGVEGHPDAAHEYQVIQSNVDGNRLNMGSVFFELGPNQGRRL